ncbi:hypothetical protein [Amycolatopsis decaplanina]|uniref:Collagen adhesion protein n=1 Tax=Amycolatopsis decaplanina DSM 44594 TaxID=1284240 RepID=M2ZQX3_9PSEU|nr:hypothetical protein [Amycolatopsis decaplanina]EME62744.1 collagen adhesion protein [Amycolatopsis decaplanina DSM 44594]
MTSAEAKVSKEPWEEALKIFAAHDAPDTHVPSRETITGIQWLKWDVYAKSRGLPDPKGWDFFASTETWWMEYWAVASANYEAFTPVMTKFYGNMDDIIESMQGYYNTNPVAQPWTFTRAFDALNGTKTWLSDQAKKLDTQRNKVGKKGDDFQGTGAGAFRDVLDGLIFKCNDLVRQLDVRPDALKDALGQQDDPQTADKDEGSGLKWAFAKLQEAHARWKSSEVFSRDTGKFGKLDLPGSQLAWPGGCLTAIWTSTMFKEDLSKARDDDWSGTGGERYPRSTILGADARNPVFWEGIASAAQNLWLDHIKNVLDPAATTVLTSLPTNYNAAKLRLPQIREPRRLNLHKAPPTPPPGSQGPPPPPPPGPGGGPKPPPGSKDGPPKIPDPSKDTKGSQGDKDKKGPNGAPPPPVPGPPKGGPKPPPAPPKPEERLKVPSGSSVGPDGVVLGPDKKPLLDPFGRQIVVPPGSRVGPNGEIIGPKGDKLAEKDRLARPEPVKKDESQQSELDKYLKSLRGGNSPSMPTLLGSHSPSVSSLSGGSPNLHNGPSAPKTTVGSIGFPGGLGAAAGHETPGPPEKPVTTEGGPSLIKNQQGNGNQQNGMGGVPFYPPTAGGAGAGAGGDQNKGERDRTTWLTEDEETWGTDPKLPPSVLGGRRRGGRVAGRGAGGPRDYGQGGNDGRLAGGATSPDHGHAQGSA